MKKYPFFIIIGAQKAGTTALFKYLSQHASLLSSSRKEVSFFGCNFLYKKGINYYLNFFNFNENLKCFEASPDYLFNPLVPKRIQTHFPEVKLIVILRNPTDRAISAYQMYRSRYIKDREWFKRWIDGCFGAGYFDLHFQRRDERSVTDFMSFINEELDAESKGINLEMSILQHGLYDIQLKRYLNYFNKNQLCILKMEDMNNNLINVLRQIEIFLDISEEKWETKDLQPVFKGKYVQMDFDKILPVLNDYYCKTRENLKNDWEISLI